MAKNRSVTYYKSDGTWYVEVSRDDEVVEDSQKVWFPFDCDGLSEPELREAIAEHYPEAAIDPA